MGLGDPLFYSMFHTKNWPKVVALSIPKIIMHRIKQVLCKAILSWIHDIYLGSNEVGKGIIPNIPLSQNQFNKAYDKIHWSFVTKMSVCLNFGARCVAMVNTLFLQASPIISINSYFSNVISLHSSIRQGCPSTQYLYALVVDILGYLLNIAILRGIPSSLNFIKPSVIIHYFGIPLVTCLSLTTICWIGVCKSSK